MEPETEQLYGVAPGTIRAYRDWIRFLTPDDARRFETERDAALAEQRPFKIEFRIQLPSGEERWILTRARGEYDSSGQLRRVLGVDIDITEQTRTVSHIRFVNRMQIEMAEARNEEPMIRMVVTELGKHLGADLVAHLDANEDHESVTIRHTNDGGQPGVVGVHCFAQYATSDARERLAVGKEVVVNDVARDPRTSAFVERYRQFDVASGIAMPFVTASGFKGGLIVLSRQPREWRRDEVQTVRGLAARLFPAIEQLRIEKKLRENEARVTAILEQLPVGVGVVDANGRFQLSNQIMRRYLPDVIASRDPVQIGRWHAVDAEGRPIPPEEWPGPRALRGEAVSPGIEFVYADDDGRERWLLVSAVPFRGAANDTFRAIAMVQDIDERKRAEAALRESEGRFRAMADGTPAMIWVTDAAGKIQFVNQAYCNFFGTTLETVQSGGWQQLIHPEDHSSYTAPFFIALNERKPFRAQARVRRADGEWRWVDSYGTPRYSAAGEFLGMAGSSPDITDRKQAEAALREADRRKGEFLATLAHELRNPLAPIRNAVQIMKLHTRNDPLLDASRDMIDRQVTHMVRLIDDLLDVNRITRGKLELRKEPAELRTVFDQALEPCARQIDDAGQHLVVSLPREPVFLEGDVARLAQVFANLLDNASKYTERGGTINVAAERKNDRVIVSVKDNGAGIPVDKLDEVFEMFAQVVRPLERPKPGLGIGLALVKQLVELHGGSVRAFSAGPGRGSEFVVGLPTLPDNSLLTRGATPPKGDSAATARRRIVIADDNADNAQSLASLLRLTGNEIWIASDGLEAVLTAEQQRPDTVLLDIGMPKLNGYEACRRIREQPWGKKMTLIAVTGWGQQEDREKSKEVGFDCHLVKPIDYSALMRLLADRESARSRH
ncbi:MAG: PAS domain S-box protein [Sulfurifustaceae bacterium]